MIISILIFLFALLVLVIVHELGHFLMAKRFGIKVEEFGFGIPPRVWGKKIGETLYSLNALPFGGFVRLQGEDKVGGTADKRDFRAKSVWQRIAVVVTGVVMNLFLAWIIFYGVIIWGNFRIIYPTLEPGVYVGFLQEGFPAQNAGLNLGDKILKVGEREIKEFEDVRNAVQKSNGQPIKITTSDVEGKNIKELTLTPQKVDQDYKAGIGFSPVGLRHYKTTGERLFSGITYSYDLTKLTFVGLQKTFSDLLLGDVKTVSKSVSGPVGLAKVSNDILSSGPGALPFYLWFVGVISLTLAIFNTLPIPAMDGGRLLFLIVEAVTRRKVREELETKVHQIGFALLLLMAVLITYSDISKIINR